jgi:hypothetical protein
MLLYSQTWYEPGAGFGRPRIVIVALSSATDAVPSPRPPPIGLSFAVSPSRRRAGPVLRGRRLGPALVRAVVVPAAKEQREEHAQDSDAPQDKQPGCPARAALLGLEVEPVVELSRRSGAIQVTRGWRRLGRCRLPLPFRLRLVRHVVQEGSARRSRRRRGRASGSRPPRVVRERCNSLPDAVASVMSAHVECVAQQFEHGVPATGDVGGLLMQELADLRIGYSAPERQVEQRPVARVQIRQCGW